MNTRPERPLPVPPSQDPLHDMSHDMSHDRSRPHRVKEPIRNIELRRAVLRVLLRAGGPVGVAEIVRVLEDDEHVEISAWHLASASQRVSNLLGWQVKRGRVRRVSRGRYEAIPDAIPRTTRWRIDHWDELG